MSTLINIKYKGVRMENPSEQKKEKVQHIETAPRLEDQSFFISYEHDPVIEYPQRMAEFIMLRMLKWE
jgi:hypothetical protein